MANPTTLAEKVFQIGFVVPDIHAAMAFFKEKLGVPEFLFIENPSLQDQTYLGKPVDQHQHLAFGYCGEMQIELIQPLSGVSSYSTFLERNPQGGMQHYGIDVADYDQAVKDMSARGFTLIQSGRNGETRFGYFDTTHVIGTLTEVVYLQPREKERFERLKRGA
jgi:methylmalonyl-CoA/ethylmalonyl-CoA epimerase